MFGLLNLRFTNVDLLLSGAPESPILRMLKYCLCSRGERGNVGHLTSDCLSRIGLSSDHVMNILSYYKHS